MFNIDYPYFDREKEIEVASGGHLPHWHQDGKLQYVSFRLADSLPQSRIRELKALAERFELSHPKPWDDKTLHDYHKLLGRVTDEQLHAGLGSCFLRQQDVREILVSSLHFRDCQDYLIVAYVIMPNHCHMVLQTAPTRDLNTIMHSIKRHSALHINRKLCRTGRVWQRESHDRLVRSPEHLKHCISYIRHNPDHLPPTDYTLYISPLWRGGFQPPPENLPSIYS